MELTPELQQVRQYLQDNKIISIELNGEQLAITFNEKSERGAGTLWTPADTSELKQVKSYLESKGKKKISLAELTESQAGKNNYWPWIIGGGLVGIGLIIGLVIYFSRKEKESNDFE